MSLNKQCDYMEKILKSSNMRILFIKLVELMIDFEIFYLDIFVRTQLFFIIVKENVCLIYYHKSIDTNMIMYKCI